MECPHSEAYHRFISDSVVMQCVIAQGSFLSHRQPLEDLLVYITADVKKGEMFSKAEDHRWIIRGPYPIVCFKERVRFGFRQIECCRNLKVGYMRSYTGHKLAFDFSFFYHEKKRSVYGNVTNITQNFNAAWLA